MDEKQIVPEQNSGQIVVSLKSGRQWFRLLLRRVVGLRGRNLWIAVAIVILIGAAGIVVSSYHTRTPRPQSPGALAVSVNKATHTGKYTDAINMINKSSLSSKDKDLLLLSVYESQKDYKSALAMYQQLIGQYGENLGWDSGAAEAAMNAHDYQQAITYYQKAQKLAAENKTDPVATANADYYAQQIKDAQELLAKSS